MNKNVLTVIFSVLAWNFSFSQNLIFSGGHFHSAMLCDNGLVYSFGQGLEGQLGNNTFVNSNSPVQVVGEGGVGVLQNIRQVDAGSGRFSIALSMCGDTVYTWGQNSEGQLGDGTTTNRSTPVRVRGAGGVGNLSNIQYISGGNGEAYAITDNDEIVAWGGNDFGQLGRGTATPSEVFPDYVMVSPGVRLTNVKFVDGGDDFGVALLYDGTVWFWGKDARGVGGQGVDNADPGTSLLYATQVRNAAGTGFLQNITKITAGDRHIMALSTGDTLFSWGANWGRQVGNNNGNVNQPLPTPVLNVNNSGGILTGVRNFAAGNAHSVAVLADGSVVSWGLRRDGHLGDNDAGGCACGGDGSPFPIYTMNPGNTAPLGGIVNVSDGDNWSFAIDTASNVYIWGRNDEGELGLGDNTDRLLPVQMIGLPCTINIPEEPPFASLGGDIDLCSPLSVTLDAGDGGASYTYAWYKDDVLLPSETNRNLLVDTSGEFKVVITKTTNTCSGPVLESATDSIDVTMSAAIPVDGTYCPTGTANLSVIGSGEYKWFDAPTGGTEVGTGNSITTPSLSGPGTETFYVEDTSAFSSRVGPSPIPGSGGNVRPWDGGSSTTQNQLRFTAISDFVIDSVTVGAYNGWDGAFAIEVSVIDVGSGLPVASAWGPVMNGASNPTTHQIYLGLSVPAAGDYYLRYTNSTNGDDRILESSFGAYSAADYPFTDPSGIVSITEHYRDGSFDDDRYSLFWDWVISTGSLCDRVPVDATVDCPACSDPGTVSISPLNPAAQCGGNVLLTASETGTPPGGGFEYEFFADTGTGAFSVQGPNGTNTFTATYSGDFYVVVTDPADAATCSATSATTTITIDANPTTAMAGSNQNICAASASLNGNISLVGVGTWTVISGTGTFSPNANDPAATVNGLSVGTNTFRWTIANGACPPSTSDVDIDVSGTVTTADAGSNDTICITAGTYALSGNSANAGNGETGTWTLVSGSATIDSPNSETSTISNLVAGNVTLRWSIDNTVCPPSTSDVTIVVDDIPTVSNAGTNQNICAASASLNANNPATGIGIWSVISGAGTFSPNSNDPPATVNGLSVGTNTFRWTITNGVCPSSSSDVDINVSGTITTADAGSNDTICITAGTYALGANAANAGNGETGIWSLVSGSATIDSPNDENSTISGLMSGAVTLRWTIDNTICTPSTSDVTILVDDVPTTSNAGTAQNICASSASLGANTPLIGVGAWTVISGSGSFSPDANDPSATVNGLSTGTNTFTWTISNGVCPASSSDVDIVVSAAPSTSVAGSNQDICADSTQLAANTPAVGTGMWSIVSGSATFSDPTDPTSDVTGLGAATTLRWTISNGVCLDETSDVVITTDNPATTADAGLDQNTCNDTTFMVANVPVSGTGTWTVQTGGPAAIDNVNDPNSMVTGFPVGMTTLRWTISTAGACPDSFDDVIIDRTASASATVVITPGTPAPVCAGTNFTFTAIPGNGGSAPTYEWFFNGISQGAGGPDTFQVMSPNNNDSIRVEMTSNLGCAIGSPASSALVSIVIDNPPSSAVAGADQSICADNYMFSATTPATGTGTWTVVSGSGSFSNLNDPAAIVSGVGVGANTYRWTVSNGVCADSTDEIVITRSGNLTTADAGSNDQICISAGTYTLSGNAVNAGNGETGSWTLVSGSATIDIPNSETSTISNLTSGSVTLRWTIDNTICTPSTSDVTILVDDLPTTANAGTDNSICGSVDTLRGNSTIIGTGIWTVVSGAGTIASTSDSVTEVTAIASGSNIFRWTISNGTCAASSDDVEISTLTAVTPVVVLNVNNPTSCLGDSLTFTATPTFGGASPQYEFFVNAVSTGGPSLSATFVDNTVPNGATVSVTMTSSLGCVSTNTATDNLNVNVVNPPTPTITVGGQTICENSSFTITTSTGSGTLDWTHNGGSTGINTNTVTIDNITESGIWCITEDNGVCAPVTSNCITMNVDELPVVDAGGNASADLGQPVVLNGYTSVGTVVWSPGANLDDTTTLNPMFTSSIGGSFSLMLTATNGTCSASDNILITVTEPLFIPNAFSPNSDGLNDVWQIAGLETYSNATLTVFNRWGSSVYKSFGNIKWWDGTRNGEHMPVATYYYILDLGVDGEKPFSGSVTIIR